MPKNVINRFLPVVSFYLRFVDTGRVAEMSSDFYIGQSQFFGRAQFVDINDKLAFPCRCGNDEVVKVYFFRGERLVFLDGTAMHS